MVPAERADVAVIGAGPAGSAAALSSPELVRRARGQNGVPAGQGVRRPRRPPGVQVLEDPCTRGAEPVGDMRGRPHRAVGPAAADPAGPIGSRCRAPVSSSTRRSAPPLSTPAASRARLAPAHRYSTTGGWRASELSDGTRLHADVVIGADGATSRVATAAGLVDAGPGAVGLSRAYLGASVDLPTIVLWDETRWRGFPGYGWVFPGPGGGPTSASGSACSATGLRPAMQPGRCLRRCAPPIRAARSLRLARQGSAAGSRWGWSERSRRGRVLLVGEAGLVNPLQGEGTRGPGQRAGSRRGRPRMPGRPGHRLPLVPGAALRHLPRRTPPSRPRSCGEQPFAAAGHLSPPLSSGMPSPAAGPSTGTSCSTALLGSGPNTAALATAIARAATSAAEPWRSVTSALTSGT